MVSTEIMRVVYFSKGWYISDFPKKVIVCFWGYGPIIIKARLIRFNSRF